MEYTKTPTQTPPADFDIAGKGMESLPTPQTEPAAKPTGPTKKSKTILTIALMVLLWIAQNVLLDLFNNWLFERLFH